MQCGSQLISTVTLIIILYISLFTSVVEYSTHVYTGDRKKADASGDAYFCICGDRGDSGKRWLNNSKTGPITFGRGQVMYRYILHNRYAYCMLLIDILQV